MKVPLLDLKIQNESIERELMDAILKVMRSSAFILGPDVEVMEKRIAAYSTAQFGIGVSSGTDALLVALMALNVGPGDEVITTPYSFFATAGVIARLGATPVFVDIDPVTYNINPALIEKAITKKTKVIVPVHLYGQCADMDPIMAIATKHGLSVVEDGAQAIGADYLGGRRAGSIGHLGCLSFFPSKNLGCMGDGGMVLTNDPDLAERVKILRVHGSKPKYYHKMIGGNFRIDTIQAAILNVKLGYLDGWTAQRQENAERYTTLLKATSLIEKVGITLPKAVYQNGSLPNYHIYNQFVLQLPRRDALRDYLKEKGIGTEVYYPVPFHLQECFSSMNLKEGDFPHSERAANDTVALPIYPGMTADQQQYVVEQIAAFYK